MTENQRILELEEKVNLLEKKNQQNEYRILFLEEQLSQVLSQLISINNNNNINPKSARNRSQSLKEYSNQLTNPPPQQDKKSDESSGISLSGEFFPRNLKYKFPGVMKSKSTVTKSGNSIKSSANERLLDDSSLMDSEMTIRTHQLFKSGNEEFDPNNTQKKIFTVYMEPGLLSRVVIENEAETLRSVLEKTCRARGLDMAAYVPLDGEGQLISLDSHLVNIKGAQVCFITKDSRNRSSSSATPMNNKLIANNEGPSGSLSLKSSLIHQKPLRITSHRARSRPTSVKIADHHSPLFDLASLSRTEKFCTYVNQAQIWYNCFDCGLLGNIGICETCSKICHKGHNLGASLFSRIACACGAKGPQNCKCITQEMINKAEVKKEIELQKSKIMSELQEKIQDLLANPISKCSIGADLPRLGLKLIIYDSGSEKIYPDSSISSLPQNPQGTFQKIRALFAILSEKLGILNTHIQHFDNHFSAFFNEKSSQLADFSRTSTEYITNILGEDSLLVKLLKCSCNQGIVAPVWVNIKINIFKDFPFKDFKNGWRIYVVFQETEIEIIHRKREQGFHAETLKEDFTFTWELRLLFTRDMEQLKSAAYAITDLIIKDDMDTEQKQLLKSCTKIWRSHSYLPIFAPRQIMSPSRSEIVVKTTLFDINHPINPPQFQQETPLQNSTQIEPTTSTESLDEKK